jgi:hypothetical protein
MLQNLCWPLIDSLCTSDQRAMWSLDCPDRPYPPPIDRGFFVLGPSNTCDINGDYFPPTTCGLSNNATVSGPDFPMAWGQRKSGPCSRCRSASSIYYRSLQHLNIYGDDRELFGQVKTRPRPLGLRSVSKEVGAYSPGEGERRYPTPLGND